MVNTELIALCRTLVAAMQESDRFDAKYLRRLILHVVPQLLVEIDILGGVLESLRLPVPEPELPKVIEAKFEAVAKKVSAARPKPKKRPATKRKARNK